MATFESLINRVKQECPSLPTVTALEALREAVREFLRDSTAWRKEINYTLPIGETILDLSSVLPADSEVLRINFGYCDNNPIYKIDANQLLRAKNFSASLNDKPKYYLKNLKTIELFPAASVEVELNLNVTLISTRNADSIDDDLQDEWKKGFEAAAFFNLMMQHKKPWTNTELAAFYRERYLSYLNTAKGEAITSDNAAKTVITPFA